MKDFPAIGTGFCLGEPAGIDNGRLGLASSDLRADLACLPVRHPQRCLKSSGETF